MRATEAAYAKRKADANLLRGAQTHTAATCPPRRRRRRRRIPPDDAFVHTCMRAKVGRKSPVSGKNHGEFRFLQSLTLFNGANW